MFIIMLNKIYIYKIINAGSYSLSATIRIINKLIKAIMLSLNITT